MPQELIHQDSRMHPGNAQKMNININQPQLPFQTPSGISYPNYIISPSTHIVQQGQPRPTVLIGESLFIH